MGRKWAIWLVAMSHNTTSWKSHRSTWRWTAGKDGRSPEGGKARHVGGRPALARQKAIGEHDQREVPMQTIPAPAWVMVQAARTCGVLVALLNRPAAVSPLDQPLPPRVLRQMTARPLHRAAFPRHWALAEQPPLRSGEDAMMAGGALRPTRGPVPPHGDKRFAEDGALVRTPGDRLPAVLRQGIEHGLGRGQWRGTRLGGLATPPWPRGRQRARPRAPRLAAAPQRDC